MPEPAIMQYIEQRDGTYRVAGTRVSLGSLVALFLDGRSPESILQSFPTLTLEQVYGALAYYLAHRPEADALLTQQEAAYAAAREASHATHRALVDRLRAARARQAAAAS
jgi:uncharacterized protein (DUF433 family)